MKLTDIASLETWQQLEKEIHDLSGLNASVFDMEGKRITGANRWVNRLCPEVKSTEKGQVSVCSLAHQNAVKILEKTKQSVVDECDAGLIKIAVPVYVGSSMLGVIGACGLLAEDGEVDTFLLGKTIEVAEEKLVELADNISTISEDSLKEFTKFIENRIQAILQLGANQIPN